MKYLLGLTAAVFLVGCASNAEWEPKPSFVMEGTFEGEITMYDPNQAPPEHPGWRVADTAISTLGTVALPYLLLRESTRSIQSPTIVEQPEPQVIRPEVVSPEIVEIGGDD